jgi:ACT domain-containing protein
MHEKKIIVSVLGRDRVGIIAAVTNTLAECNANILDISQTILQDYFTMIMVVDIKDCKVDFLELKDKLKKVGEEIGIQVNIQNAEIFDFMHRI